MEFQLSNGIKIIVESDYGTNEEIKTVNEIKEFYGKSEKTPEIKILEKENELIREQLDFGKDLVYEIKNIAGKLHCEKGFLKKEEYKTAISRIVNLIEESYFEL